ncbi:MAG: hypothetical protein ACYTFM_04740 [Planctomycetota bacterium]|jgi:hypothetical protein
MRKEDCEHIWEMITISDGLIVMKKCFHCGKVSTCFCFHHELPMEASREEDHFWNFVEGDQAFHFDLKCTKCNLLVEFDELVGLVRCVGCDEKCKVNEVRKTLESKGSQVLIALGRRPIDERKQIPQEKLQILQKYFDQQNEKLNFKVKIVSHDMVRRIDSCYAEVIADPQMLSTLAANKDQNG